MNGGGLLNGPPDKLGHVGMFDWDSPVWMRSRGRIGGGSTGKTDTTDGVTGEPGTASGLGGGDSVEGDGGRDDDIVRTTTTERR